MSDSTQGSAAVTAVTDAAFRATLASVCGPVAVVTAMDGARPHGTTVSSFSSLSLDPPLIMTALDRRSELLAIIRGAQRFGVNLLGHSHVDLALRFAQKGTTKFAGVHWSEDHQTPRLAESAGWLACDLHTVMDGGDHEIVVGTVLAADPIDGAPLVYHNRKFGTHSAFLPSDTGSPA